MEASNELDSQTKNLESLNLNTNENSNFNKKVFEYENEKYELALNYYSNLVMVILTNNNKFGSTWLSEMEENEDDFSDEIFFELKCILGDRKNEYFQFLSNLISNRVFNSLKTNKIQNPPKTLMISISMKAKDVDKDYLENDFSNITEKHKKFVDLLLQNLDNMI